MACQSCLKSYAGALVPVDQEGNCIECGDPVVAYYLDDQVDLSIVRWDKYFHTICDAVATKSPCLSRQIGVVLVRDKSIISTGYNGPARGFPHCEGTICPRKVAGYKSGEGLELCPAAHAETNAIANAARIGTSVSGSTLYMNSVIPCKFCAVSIVNAGISEVVVEELTAYHEISIKIFKSGGVELRSFDIQTNFGGKR